MIRLIAALAFVFLSGCTQHSGSSSSSSGGTGETAASALQFDYKNTTELLIAKSDPGTGDRWSARIVRDGPPSPLNENLWTFASGPEEIASGDHKAFGLFILHMLDTVRTLKIKDAEVSGSPESFGLAPPMYSLKWRAAEIRSGGESTAIQARVFKEYEISLGSPVKNANGEFQGLYATLGGLPDHIFVAQGALLEMLSRINGFQSMRLPTLTTFTSDDVDEFELDRGKGKSHFYAQREGDRWTDVKHRPVKPDMDALLDQATHLRILRFIDDPVEQGRLRPLFSKSTYSVTFKDRHGTPTTLKITTGAQNKVYATLSTRSCTSANQTRPAIFEVYPDLLTSLKQL